MTNIVYRSSIKDVSKNISSVQYQHFHQMRESFTVIKDLMFVYLV